ncbi:uncharacterized protein AMSG_08866 [Thecamonas trahens ATCC 50062]|uniref:Guanylate cyclase domain-containing protein n=1 Tax=Thecamonas trahens ATCC 50062 TaxID=461836 RepID=A0A0L0DM71_THETB|nr:hypothetical protein AMSG_08866 [Thecamonas trahens ATCC 50062]KNC53365.1 hypothetical protein AMSG_08866 [Thecamonas trahens ATCC 50062]|eukprot:XP_013754411.1 hypothetical protein AMSG_08866 [Thecamonas trahens ATCC 50062]
MSPLPHRRPRARRWRGEAIVAGIVAVFALVVAAGGAEVWLSELHYDNGGLDVNEGVEVTATAGTLMNGYKVAMYNQLGDVYGSVTLPASTMPDEGGSGYGAMWVAYAGLQNGPQDGIALVRIADSAVLQFVSWGGTTTGTAGEASGLTSHDIGAVEGSTTAETSSLGHAGIGVAARPAEQCDDGNDEAGDGCSASCAIEGGYACLTPGTPCTTCTEHSNGMDCAGTCGGVAYIDKCGECVGGTTGRGPGASRDECGVCFGDNAAKDACGMCFGHDAALDGCGVCFGDNSTCAGCDGIPHSGAVRDVCGVCAGDGSTCVGCDGVPIPSGGAVYDACGVCGGNATVCRFGCDGVYASGVHFDCHGVCGGSGIVDDCGMCAGGNVSTPLAFNYHRDSCGVCFGQDLTCTTCASGVLDVCGVCDGDNSTCAGCDGVPIALGGAVVDLCGMCGGDSSSCEAGCDGVPNSGVSYDCAGECGGLAAIDSCGMCYGPALLVTTAEVFLDQCGVCFGGNAGLDSCGKCHRSNADRDECGVCFGNNAAKDVCGECFGSGLALDVCGECRGNGTTCLGCDGVPNSGLVSNECGICALPGVACPVTRSKTKAWRNSQWAGIAMGSSLLLFLIIGGVLLAVFLRRKRTVRILAYQAKLESEAPSGKLAIVTSDIQDSTALWEAEPDRMADVLDMHNDLMRRAIEKSGGYEFKTEGDAFFVVFDAVTDAAAYAVDVQRQLLAADWPEWVGDTGGFPAVPCYSSNASLSMSSLGDALLWRGIRVRLGIHYAEPERVFEKRANRVQYIGPAIKMTTMVGDVANGGQILASRSVVDELLACEAPVQQASSAGYGLAPFARASFGAFHDSVELWHVAPHGLEQRIPTFTFDRLEREADVVTALIPEPEVMSRIRNANLAILPLPNAPAAAICSGTSAAPSLTIDTSSSYRPRTDASPRVRKASMGPARSMRRSRANSVTVAMVGSLQSDATGKKMVSSPRTAAIRRNISRQRSSSRGSVVSRTSVCSSESHDDLGSGSGSPRSFRRTTSRSRRVGPLRAHAHSHSGSGLNHTRSSRKPGRGLNNSLPVVLLRSQTSSKLETSCSSVDMYATVEEPIDTDHLSSMLSDE